MPHRMCSAEGCERVHYAKGLCKSHYRQQPDQLAKARYSDSVRRKRPEHRERDRVRLERKRRANGVQPRPTPGDKASRRRQAKHNRAARRLQRAAAGVRGTRKWIAGPCAHCAHSFVGSGNTLCCSRTCRLRLERRKRKNTYGNDSHRRRARRFGVPYESVDRVAVFERDRYRCQICKEKTKGSHWLSPGKPNPLAPTLDHIVPLACGGPHTFSNLQCACFACNCLKGDRGADDQLRLV